MEIESFRNNLFCFQAEDCIRDGTVTGVQTCALPIFAVGPPPCRMAHGGSPGVGHQDCHRAPSDTAAAQQRSAREQRPALLARAVPGGGPHAESRSEERRVGKEGGGACGEGSCEKWGG